MNGHNDIFTWKSKYQKDLSMLRIYLTWLPSDEYTSLLILTGEKYCSIYDEIFKKNASSCMT